MPINRRLTQLSAKRELTAPSQPIGGGRDAWARQMGGGGMAGALSGPELEWKRSIFERIVRTLDLSQITELEVNEARRQINDTCERLMAEEAAPFPQTTRRRIITEIQDEILGFGPLEPLLKDPTVSDILVNGPAQVYV
ncbi:MAG: CpaF family protein, partial [Gammaproteobacteria bacterium]|nr:CpaF family protein [Gammaproteobacteria bacterium]